MDKIPILEAYIPSPEISLELCATEKIISLQKGGDVSCFSGYTKLCLRHGKQNTATPLTDYFSRVLQGL